MKPININTNNDVTVRELLLELCPHFCIDYKVYYDGEELTLTTFFKYENSKVLAWRINEDMTEGVYIELFSEKM